MRENENVWIICVLASNNIHYFTWILCSRVITFLKGQQSNHLVSFYPHVHLHACTHKHIHTNTTQTGMLLPEFLVWWQQTWATFPASGWWGSWHCQSFWCRLCTALGRGHSSSSGHRYVVHSPCEWTQHGQWTKTEWNSQCAQLKKRVRPVSGHITDILLRTLSVCMKTARTVREDRKKGLSVCEVLFIGSYYHYNSLPLLK